MPIKILNIVGARPNFMKIAPIIEAMRKRSDYFESPLLHTGQHYDQSMNDQFFDQLGIPRPDMDLEVGSGSHAVQTGEIMRRFEPVLQKEKPNAILVVGDVNSTIACALVATKEGIPVIHVEAGLRSFDRAMPEEINRVLTDQISEMLFTTERPAREQLLKEGIHGDKIHFVGNVMIDTLYRNLPKAISPAQVLQKYEHKPLAETQDYAVLTLHRPSNVDDKSVLLPLLTVIREISEELPILFPIHPRAAARLNEFQLEYLLDTPRIMRMPPLGYLEMLGLNKSAKVVLTDSGGIQEETTAMGVACVTLRENTERPVTVSEGTNTIVGTDANKIRHVLKEILDGKGKSGRIPELWDGKAAERICDVICEKFSV